MISKTLSCFWRMDAGQDSSIGPFTQSLTAFALFMPVAMSIILSESIISDKPIVMACFGTSFMEVKKRELSLMVLADNDTTCVMESNDVPGSLKPMCPLDPIPNI